jgi:hypothetical protein
LAGEADASLTALRGINPLQANVRAADFEGIPIYDARNADDCLRRNRQGHKQQAECQGQSQQESVHLLLWGVAVIADFFLPRSLRWVEAQRLTGA